MNRPQPTRSYCASDRMRDVLDDNPSILPVLSRFGIPLGFGNSSVSDVCHDNSVHCSTFLAVANIFSGYPHSHLKLDVRAITDYLKNAHAYYLDYVNPLIRKKLVDAVEDAFNNEFTLLLVRFFDEYVEEMKSHILYENEEILNYENKLMTDEFKESLKIFQVHHHSIADKLNEIKDLLICHFQADVSKTDVLNNLLFDIMTFERDLLSHCQVEDVLFVPAMLGINVSTESNERHRSGKRMRSLDEKGDVLLTPRERDIVRAIARGLSNKEIAEMLFLSIHTVTTHRRNISSKLGIHSASGMTLYAILHGLITLDEGKNLMA